MSQTFLRLRFLGRTLAIGAWLGLLSTFGAFALAADPPPEAAAPPAIAAPWLTLKGRVLDFALADLDEDQADELLLLFPGRLELWQKEGAGWRFAQLAGLGTAQKGARATFGRLVVCPFGPGQAPLVYASLADLPETATFAYTGRGLRLIGQTPGAVLACAADGPLHAHYEAAAARFAPELSDEAGRALAKAPGAFLALVAGPGQALFLMPDGRLTTPTEEQKGLRCGLTPQRLADGRLACSLPLVEPDTDGVQLFSFPTAAAPVATTVVPPAPGAIWALRIWKEAPTAKEELALLRYFPERDESQLLRQAL